MAHQILDLEFNICGTCQKNEQTLEVGKNHYEIIPVGKWLLAK